MKETWLYPIAGSGNSLWISKDELQGFKNYMMIKRLVKNKKKIDSWYYKIDVGEEY